LIDSSIKGSPEQVLSLFGVDLGKDNDEVDLFNANNDKRTAKIAYFTFCLEKKAVAELEKLEAYKLFKEVELPLSDTLADMEIEGFPLNADKLDEFGNEFKKKEAQLKQEIYNLAGEEFNLASPKQLGDILFNKLGLSKNRKMSTSVDNLKELIDDHPIVEKVLEYRKYFKLITTYIDGLKPHIYSDGKIHAHFNQALTTTGRLSSSNPNLQNISVRDEEGKMIRQAFYYPEEDVEILSLDYSQIELRILAYLSNCQKLKNIFMSGEDIHSATAKSVFNIEGEPTANQRRRAKAVNFGIVYGISDWGLAEQIDVSPKEAHHIIESFYESFPEIRDFFMNIIDEAKKNGYVSTLLGRRRYLRDINDSNYQTREFAKRAAMNAPIQGTAADLIKVAMIKVDQAIKEKGYKSKMVLQIHDELIFKVYKEEKEELFKMVKSIMESALQVDIPLEVDGGFGKDWYSAK
ncbi:MAG: DNA polymerase I, partial [Lachnospira sp.]|nr:DNA polymerase I [Lachnospira sp.]